MKYLLDTNAVIALLKGQPEAVRRRLRRVMARGEKVALPSIAVFELWYGVARSSRRRENAERIKVLLSGTIGVMPFEEEDARVAGELRAALETAGTPIGPYDLLIAAQSLRTGATLVTANVAEFKRVPGLAWQDWAARP